MVKLYSEDFELPKDLKAIDQVSLYFRGNIHKWNIDEKDLELMKTIDNVSNFDSSRGAITTPFGITLIDNLSSGCKTCLVINHCLKRGIEDIAISLERCGSNALDLAFELLDGTKLIGIVSVTTYLGRGFPGQIDLNESEFVGNADSLFHYLQKKRFEMREKNDLSPDECDKFYDMFLNLTISDLEEKLEGILDNDKHKFLLQMLNMKMSWYK